MKNIKRSVKKEIQPGELAVLALQDEPMINVFGSKNFDLDPQSPGAEKYPPLITPEQEAALRAFYKVEIPSVRVDDDFFSGAGIYDGFDEKSEWIQTHSGRRFCPTNPNPEAIVLQDIAHSLSMQCRFTGHCKHFYSVAQHSVLVSYLCDSQDALWGLLHDASEAYLIDVPRPLKRSGKFGAYIEFEKVMQDAICTRFGLSTGEPPSVKKADTIMLATEARDLMSPLHKDWRQPVDPLPFLIDPWGPQKSKDMFMKRFFELKNMPVEYQYYLDHKDSL